MIRCKELDKDFETKSEMFKALVANKQEIIALKKSTIKRTDGVSFRIENAAIKNLPDGSGLLAIGDTIQAVINTTMYFDHHRDVHINGIWNKSAREQTGKTFHVINHDLVLGSIVAYPKDVRIEVRTMTWRELGYDADGSTEALIFHTKMTDKTNEDAFKAYRDGEPVQHSIRMEYVSLALAVNDPEMKEEYALYQKYLPMIANKEDVEENGYFWAVFEAKISKEGSTVLFGSNEITPALNTGNKSTTEQPGYTTAKEPQTPESPAFDFMKALSETTFIN